MFTGIIKDTGEIKKIEKNGIMKTFTIKAKKISDFKLGQSIAINGVCLTITKFENKNFTIQCSSETLEVSTFGELKEKDIVNIETALKLNDGLDGHLVQGHVDAIGEISKITKNEDKLILKIKFPKNINKFLAFKGSITVDGISLTIAKLTMEHFTIELIPYTIQNTNLSYKEEGSKVNIETDMIARYLEKMVQKKENESKYEFLKTRGFL